MRVRTIFTEEQPAYRYMKLPTMEADVFVYDFIEKIKQEDGEQFIYDMNEFRIRQEHITEEMVKKNPKKYLDYEPTKEITITDRVEALEGAILEIMEGLYD